MDGTALAELARRAAAHRWTFTRDGLEAAAGAMGWELGGRHGDRVDLRTASPFEPAWAMFLGDVLAEVECTLVPTVFTDPDDDDAIEDLEEQMLDRFEEAADAVASAIGKPSFRDGRAHPRFPKGEHGVEWLATWPTETARLAVKQVHESGERSTDRLGFVVEPLR